MSVLRHAKQFCPVVLLAGSLSFVLPAAQVAFRPTGEDFDSILARVAKYDFGQNREPVAALSDAVRRAMPNPEQLSQIENKLCGFLESGASPAAKDAASRELCLIATERSVPALSRLLAHRETAELALRILERIPGGKTGEILRKALLNSSGSPRIAIINALAVRRDPGAVPLLRQLTGSRLEESRAAVAALGSIATPAAVQALRAAGKDADANCQAAVSRALMASAERMQEMGDRTGANEIYRDLLSSSRQETVKIAALRGLAAAGSPEAMQAITRMLAGKDPHVQTAALQVLGQMPGAPITNMMIEYLSTLPRGQQVQVITALANRGDNASLSAVKAAAGGPDAVVRTAALRALGDVGDASSVRTLASAAARATEDEQEAARASLLRLRGSEADSVILSDLVEPDTKVRIELIRAAGQRGISAAVPRLLRSASDQDADVRRESQRALSRTAGPEHIHSLVDLLLDAPAAADRQELERAISAVLQRHPTAGVGDLITSFRNTSDAEDRGSLLRVLATVGATDGLPLFGEALRQKDASLRRAAILALSDWPNSVPADELLRVARECDEPEFRILALRGYTRLVGLPSERSAAQTVALLAEAMKLATQPEEKKSIVALLPNYVCAEALELARAVMSDRDVSLEAENAVQRLQRSLTK